MTKIEEKYQARLKLSKENRAYQAVHHIDPGFFNYRRLEAFIPEMVKRSIDREITQYPQHLHPQLARLRTDHSYVRHALEVCKIRKAKTLSELLSSETISKGDIVCSTDAVEACEDVYDAVRVSIKILTPIDFPCSASFSLSTSNIVADTTRLQLHQGDIVSYIALVEKINDQNIILTPLILGAPDLWPAYGDEKPPFDIMWWPYDFFEHFVEDIDELEKVNNIQREESSQNWHVLKDIPEQKIKEFFCSILRDTTRKDWGGERSDHFSSNVHINGRRMSAAFLLKGPSVFSPMTAKHLGKNGDQIYRLTSEPAELFILQHCHLITEPVRAQLRAFSVNPSNPRRYCLIDGPDTYRVLVAYGFDFT